VSTPSNPNSSGAGSSNGGSSRRRGGDRAGRDYTGFGFREVGADDALDQYLDGEITRESGAFRAAFVKREFRERLGEAEAMISQLRKPMRTPDLSDAILGAVDARKSFVATGTRRFVTAGRFAAAASVLLAVGGVVLLERSHPILAAFRDDVEPVSGMVSAASLPGGLPGGLPVGLVESESATSSQHDPDRKADASAKQGATLVTWTLARLGRIESVEVLHGPTSVASASQSGTAWHVDRSAGTVSVPEVASEWSVGFATFPTPDQHGRDRFGKAWATRGW
jgi:hypothetical protein